MVTTSSIMHDKSLVITHIFEAPREVVWEAWTKPEHLAEWWGPEEFTNPTCEIDVRPEGAIRIDMRGPDGTVYPMTGRFIEVVKPERLVFSNTPLDNAGNILFELMLTAEFTDNGNTTTLRLTSQVISETPAAAQYLGGMETGLKMSLSKLDRMLEINNREQAPI
ncbi:MAG: hypothetical protein JWO42_2783 [Chloroflexi bacterium]|jgi:uncharacterized protein YndB with AHSA1/START domain|nr:hypothetical protein [Chloroflexota bacterium]